MVGILQLSVASLCLNLTLLEEKKSHSCRREKKKSYSFTEEKESYTLAGKKDSHSFTKEENKKIRSYNLTEEEKNPKEVEEEKLSLNGRKRDQILHRGGKKRKLKFKEAKLFSYNNAF